MNSVLRKWVLNLPLKMQTILISAIRGPDERLPDLKKITRWIRYIVLENADQSSNFMRKELRFDCPKYLDAKHEFEFCRVHYAFHLLHAMKIIGTFHPDEKVRTIAMDFFDVGLYDLHLTQETKDEQLERLRNK